MPEPAESSFEPAPAGGRAGASAPERSCARWWSRALVLLALPLALIGPALLPGRLFLPQHPIGYPPLATESPEAAARAWEHANYCTGDRLFPCLTDQVEIRAQVLGGSLPTWEPKLGLGLPLIATAITGTAYPPNALALLVPPERAAAWLAIAALFLAGLGMWLFAARLGLCEGAAAVGAIAFQGGGFALANLHYPMKVDAALWLPWSLWAIEGIARGRRRSGPALAASIGMSLLAGFPPIALFALCASALFALVRLSPMAGRLTGIAPCERAPRAALAAGAFALLGIGLGAVQLLPTAEASRASLRQDRTAADMQNECLPWTTTLGLVIPDLIGSPREPVFAPHVPLAWWIAPHENWPATQGANPLEWNTYAGTAAVLLALAALIAAPGAAFVPALLALLALGFAQGWPIVRLLHHLPGLNLGAPARALSIAWLAFAWLAALGADALLCRSRRAFAGLAVGGAALIASAAVLWLDLDPATWPAELEATLAARHAISADDVREVVRPADAVRAAEHLRGRLVLVIGASAATLAGAWIARARARALGIALVLAAQAFAVGREHVAPRAQLDAPLFPSSASISAVAAAAGDDEGGGRVLRFDASASGAEEVVQLARPNMLQPYGIADLTGYVAFTPRTFVELFEALDARTRFRSGISRLPATDLLDHPILDLARVTAILSVAPLEHPRLVKVFESRGFCVYRRTGAAPLAHVVPSARVVSSDDEALALLAERARDPSREVVLAPGSPSSVSVVSGEGADWRPGTVRARRTAPNRLEVDIQGSSGGWLVVAEQWYPGWKAERNGARVETLRANHAFRAYRLPSGDSKLVTWYAPRSLALGALISLVSLAAVLVALIASRRLAAQ